MRALLSIALLAAACTPSFPSASDVTDLRVLAVAAEPPEAFADLDAGTVQPVTVRVLVADPAQRGPVQMSGVYCFPTTDDLRCDDPKVLLAVDAGSVAAPDAGELDLAVAPPADAVKAALTSDKLQGLGGVRVQFNATVTDGDPNGPVTAEKVLLFSLVPPAQANHSPQITGLGIVRASGTVETLHDGDTLELGVFEEVGIRPLIPASGPGGQETYTTTTLDGRTVTLTENFQYSFFTTTGAEFDQETAYEPVDPNAPPPPDGLSRLRSYAVAQGRFWVVVRDGRGGVQWIAARFTSG